MVSACVLVVDDRGPFVVALSVSFVLQFEQSIAASALAAAFALRTLQRGGPQFALFDYY